MAKREFVKVRIADAEIEIAQLLAVGFQGAAHGLIALIGEDNLDMGRVHEERCKIAAYLAARRAQSRRLHATFGG